MRKDPILAALRPGVQGAYKKQGQLSMVPGNGFSCRQGLLGTLEQLQAAPSYNALVIEWTQLSFRGRRRSTAHRGSPGSEMELQASTDSHRPYLPNAALAKFCTTPQLAPSPSIHFWLLEYGIVYHSTTCESIHRFLTLPCAPESVVEALNCLSSA